MKRRWRRWRLALRKAFRRVVYSRSSTQSIAAGAALGVFIGLTPTVGLQMLIAALAATVLRVNRLAAILPVWITNPFTIVPIYYFNFLVGTWIWPAEAGSRVVEGLEGLAAAIGAVSVSDLWGSMGAVFAAMGRLGADILVPLIVGSVVVGVVCAAATYPLALWAVGAVRRRRQLVAVRKAERRIATLKAAGLFGDGDAVGDDADGADSVDEPLARGEPETVASAARPGAESGRDAFPPPQIVSLPARPPSAGPGEADDPPSLANGA